MPNDVDAQIKYLDQVAELLASGEDVAPDAIPAAATIGIQLAQEGHLGEDGEALNGIVVMMLGGYDADAVHALITLLAGKSQTPDPSNAASGLPPIQAAPSTRRTATRPAGPPTTTAMPAPTTSTSKPAGRRKTTQPSAGKK